MDEQAVPPVVALRAWRPAVAGIREVFHATFAEHAYPRHAHDTWTLFVVDAGAVRYDLGRHARIAEPSMVSVLPPHVAHDGRPASDDGYRMRVLYVETSILPEDLVGAAVDRPFLVDAGLRSAIGALNDALSCPDDVLEAESGLHAIADRVRASLAGSAGPVAPAHADARGTRATAEAVRAALDADLFGTPWIAPIAAGLGVGPTAAARAFRETFGIPPHAYVLGRRLEAARERILEGRALADVAAEVGFVDQAHLTRHFRRHLGTTPGRFARGR
jgi:AraC-like DNA-binding protein